MTTKLKNWPEYEGVNFTEQMIFILQERLAQLADKGPDADTFAAIDATLGAIDRLLALAPLKSTNP